MREKKSTREKMMIAGLVVVLVMVLLPHFATKEIDEAEELAARETAAAELSVTLTEGAARAVDVAESIEIRSIEAMAIEETSGIAAVVTAEPFFFAERNIDDPIVTELTVGDELLLEPTDDPMWYSCKLDGENFYVYSDHVRSVDSEESLFADYLSEKLLLLQNQLPEGKYWNHIGIEGIAWGEETPWIVTDTPCSHTRYGEGECNFYNGATAECFPYEGALCQCLGFASLLSDQIFGEAAPIRHVDNYRDLRVGDHIRLSEWTHSMTVVGVDEDGITVAECNENYEDCKISWSRVMSWDEVASYDWDAEYLTRYPLDEVK